MALKDLILFKFLRINIFLLKVSGLFFVVEPKASESDEFGFFSRESIGSNNKVGPIQDLATRVDDIAKKNKTKIEKEIGVLKNYRIAPWNYFYCAIVFFLKFLGLPFSNFVSFFWTG